MIAKPKFPGKCVLEEVMHMPMNDPRHDMYLNIFDSMRSNACQVLGKDGVAVLWNNIPILNMTAEEHPILKRFVGDWAGSEILVRVLCNARDWVTRGEKAKRKGEGCKANGGSEKNSDSADNGKESNEESALEEPGSSSSDSNAVDDEENWLSKPVAPAETKKPKPLKKPSTKAGRKDAPKKLATTQNSDKEESNEVGVDEIAPVKSKSTSKSTSKDKHKTPRMTMTVPGVTKKAHRRKALPTDTGDKDKDAAEASNPISTSKVPSKHKVSSDNETTDEAEAAQPKSTGKSTKSKKKTPVVDNDNEIETKPPVETRPTSRGKSTGAKPLSAEPVTVDNDESELSAAPSGQGSKRKHVESDEGDLEHAASKPCASLPTAPMTRNTSPELPSTLRETSPAPTQILSSPAPAWQAKSKKRKAEELACKESESWEDNFEAEIAKLEASSRNSKKGKPTLGSPLPKDKGTTKPSQGKQAARQDSSDDIRENRLGQVSPAC
ncbi:hypothetical protein RSOLAG22IIIB_08691 [Rhizoctonia solani]|uniref:Uncharacterized protein n=1 Tax=Rhizoctonia solani TaxID=456999 RepID=A0A0K6FU04_9AGAM|nr:hypothetical protein RSOLAG22IIIB_08691 [Rhizoctonia solani]